MTHTTHQPSKPSFLLPRQMTVPTAAELGGLFIKFCAYWAGKESNYQGEIPEKKPSLPLEWTVRWEGAVRGMLVIRYAAEFSNCLQKNPGFPHPNFSDQDLPREMASLYGAYVIHSFWAEKFREIGPII